MVNVFGDFDDVDKWFLVVDFVVGVLYVFVGLVVGYLCLNGG